MKPVDGERGESEMGLPGLAGPRLLKVVGPIIEDVRTRPAYGPRWGTEKKMSPDGVEEEGK